MRLDGDDVTRSERLTARTKLPELEAELEQIAENNVAKKEYDKKEGIKPTGYTREERWESYVEEQERKKKDDEEAKESSMFKDYHDLCEATKVSYSAVVLNAAHMFLGRTTHGLHERWRCQAVQPRQVHFRTLAQSGQLKADL